MSIGTSLGGFFPTDMDMHVAPFMDDQPGVKVPDRSVSKDQIERDAQEEAEMRMTLPPRELRISDKKYYDSSKGYTDFFNGIVTNPDAEGFVKAPSEQAGRGINGYDYDYKSFFEDNPNAKLSPGQHYPDTYKKPNHPTFSDESRYNGTAYSHPDTGAVENAEGGHWEQLYQGDLPTTKGPHWSFTPGKTNLQFHTPQELIDYFKKNEPNSQLILPGQ